MRREPGIVKSSGPAGFEPSGINGSLLAGRLACRQNPEHVALLRVIGSFMSGMDEWSDAELPELGTMLVRSLSMEEIARLPRRDHGEVRDNVVDVGCACRG